MGGMQPYERIVSSAKQIGLYRQTFVDQTPPLNHCPDQKCRSKSDRQKPPALKQSKPFLAKGAFSEVNRYAARKQADGEKNGHTKNLLRRGSGETFADVVQVGNYEDTEDRRLCRNQAVHSNPP